MSIQNYRPIKKNILAIGLVLGQKYSEITFLILFLNPTTKKDCSLLKISHICKWDQKKGSDLSRQ
jgi:hypothetical protein